MTRPSSHTDRLLIKTARKMFPSTGCARLNLRDVAKKSGVNLGMFHYHFKTKNEFVRRVLEDFYEDFFLNFDLEPAAGRTPRARLSAVLSKTAFFFRDNLGFMSALIGDLMNNEPLAIQFARENFARHAGVLFRLIADCQRAGVIERLPPPQIVSFIMPAVCMPMLVVSRMKFAKALKKSAKSGGAFDVCSDEAILRRVEMALEGVSVRTRRRKTRKRRSA